MSPFVIVGLSCLCSIILIILTSVHGVNTFLDLCTKDRASIKCNHGLFTITRSYKLNALLIIITMILYCIFCINQFIGLFKFADCSLTIRILVITIGLARLTMSLVFILRLYIVYNKTMYKYNVTILIIISILNIIVFIALSSIGLMHMEINVEVKDIYFVHCSAKREEIWIIVICMYDMFIFIICVFAFTYPLSSIIQYYLSSFVADINNNSITDTDTDIHKIENTIKIATKSHILAVTALLSAIILFISLLCLANNIFISIDGIINTICLALLTPYYYQYYDKLCCGCIKLCNCVENRYISSLGLIRQFDISTINNNNYDIESEQSSTIPFASGTATDDSYLEKSKLLNVADK